MDPMLLKLSLLIKMKAVGVNHTNKQHTHAQSTHTHIIISVHITYMHHVHT